MTAPMPNAELAYKVLDHIDAHPELWRQDFYIGKVECGTAACFAGWACLLSGDQPNFDHPMSGGRVTSWLTDGDDVSARAQQLLRASRYLTDSTGDADDERDLFYEFNDREELGQFVVEIFGPRPDAAS